MSDSNITKKALAGALKELMQTNQFAKINISDICGKCEMNRKSFYYHFKDKYDLVNWIFDTEFIDIARNRTYESTWELFDDLCTYLYENKVFYRKAFQITGQDSFSDHFREFCSPMFEISLSKIIIGPDITPFFINFCTEALLASIQSWLREPDCLPASEYLKLLQSCIEIIGNGTTYTSRH